MRSFWTKSQKKKEENFSFLFYFLIENEEEERSPHFLTPASLPSLSMPQHSGAI